jgi:hypothetical protein
MPKFAKLIKNIFGGSHSSVKKANKGTKQESHHLIAQDACKGILSSDKGPAIAMTPEDHQQTASWGRRKGAVAFRQQQKQLLLQGCPDQALKKGIDDVRAKFGSKYEPGIQQAQEYWQQQNLSQQLKNKVQPNQTTAQKLAPLKQSSPGNSSLPNPAHQLDQKLGNLKQSTPQTTKINNTPSSSPVNSPKPNP